MLLREAAKEGSDGVRRAEGEAERDVGQRALPERDRDDHRHPRARRGSARAGGRRDLARPRVRHRRGRRAGRRGGRRRDRDRPRARADRDREGARRASAASRSTTASAIARTSTFEDASFDVVSSTCGSCSRPTTRRAARELARVVKPGRPDRARELDSRREAASRRSSAIMRPFQPARRRKAPAYPFDWGDEAARERSPRRRVRARARAARVAAARSDRRGRTGSCS